MSDSRDALTALESAASKELLRLSRPIAIDPRAELVYRVWPFLQDLVEAIQEMDGDDEPPPIPVDLVARCVGLLVGMVNHLGQPMAPEEIAQVAAHVQEVAEELIALVDPDELAEFVASVTQPEQAPVPDNVIDMPAVAPAEPIVAAAEQPVAEAERSILNSRPAATDTSVAEAA